MSDIRRLLEKMDSMASAEKNPTGPKFPGYWKGKDPASKAKSKMVGSAEESVLKDLDSTAKKHVTEWELQQAFEQYKNDEKVGGRYDPEEFDAMVSRVGAKAKQGPMKTVYDPETCRYKNVPANKEKQVKEYGNAQNPDSQSTTPGAAGSLQADKENDAGARLGAAATQKNIAALKMIEPNLNPQISKVALAKTAATGTQMSGAEIGQAKELAGMLEPALKDPQIGSQVTTLLRKASQVAAQKGKAV